MALRRSRNTFYACIVCRMHVFHVLSFFIIIPAAALLLLHSLHSEKHYGLKAMYTSFSHNYLFETNTLNE